MVPASPCGVKPVKPRPTFPDAIERSRLRCAGQGLAPERRPPEPIASRSELSERLEANARLVAYAQPVIEHLHQQIARSSSMVLLADPQGMILRSVGDSDFVSRAARVSLGPGAIWSESLMGTNAIGTALEEQGPVAVFGEQHYFERNHFLTCIATPIVAPSGGVLGILDVSSDARVTHSHAQALLQTTAEIIENRLIETVADGCLVLRFHPVAEALGTPLEGVAVFNEAGALVACNRRARQLFGKVAMGDDFARCFTASWRSVLEHAARHGARPLSLRMASGCSVAAAASLRTVLRARGAAPAGAPAPLPRVGVRPPPVRSLGGMGLGDERVAEAVRRAQRIAEHDIPLLIQGETGTGKEFFACAFHHAGRRASGPFVAVNCAAIPAGLIEAELFGYVAGAYTGAGAQGAPGKLREAHGGTLFLDEIGDMPLNLQAVLLRVLETRRVAPLGGGAEEAVDIGLVCASHRPLRELAAEGQFRADLFFRLSGMTLSLPPLRERSDFAALAQQMLDEECGRPGCALSAEALAALCRYPWPGNLRQLRNVLRLAVAMMGEEGGRLLPEHLPPEILEDAAAPAGGAGARGLRAAEAQLVQDAVARHGGNISAAARELGITRTTLYRKLRQAAERP